MSIIRPQAIVLPTLSAGTLEESRPPGICLENTPTREITEGRYVARFARTEEEIDAALRLRFEVFNLELNEGLEASFINERDEDNFDKICHHLIVLEKDTGQVVGTYRVLTLEMACDVAGFYSAGEFTLETLPAAMLAQSLEIGRACIARDHRNTRVLFLLWKGLAMYLTAKNKRYLFGCCSLSSQDFTEARRTMRRLVREGFCHPTFRVGPREDFAPKKEDYLTVDTGEEIRLPKLFETYLRIGAKVCGEPVIDRNFKTIDFFVIFDVRTIDERYHRMFFS